MNLLLDTHTWLWCALQDEGRHLSPQARAAIEDAETIYLSAATYWEISIKISLGKLKVQGGTWDWEGFDEGVRENQATWLPIQREHCQQASQLPRHHGDPFDRLLVAQARVEKLVLVTKDSNIKSYDVPTLW